MDWLVWLFFAGIVLFLVGEWLTFGVIPPVLTKRTKAFWVNLGSSSRKLGYKIYTRFRSR
jgi:hypothetical protein